MTLETLLSKARALENSEKQAQGIEKQLASTNIHEEANRIDRSTSGDAGGKSQQCRNCGLSWPHVGIPCPARGQTCHKCKKLNHYARVCRSTVNREMSAQHQKSLSRKKLINQETKHKIQRVKPDSEAVSSESSSSEDEYLYACRTNESSKMPSVKVKLNNVRVKMLIDTGASINIIDEKTFAYITQFKPISLQRAHTKLFAYGSKQQLPILGKFDIVVESKKRITVACIHVVKGNSGSLLSYQTASELNMITLHVNKVTSTSSVSSDDIEQKYPDIYNGIGKLKEFEVKLHIDKQVPPVAQPARRIPFHLRKKVSAALKQLEKDKIIEKVEGPTPWVSPLVVIPKNDGTVRLCVDMRMPNCAIKREHHPTPTVDDLIHAMNGAKVFSKLDLRSGYHQLILAKDSRYITTFATHKGLYRYKRLNFGTNSASEIFQKVIHDQIHDIPGALNISDDVIIYGKSQKEHDAALHAVCQRFTEIGLTLNKEKCLFNQNKLIFFGLVFSCDGISADPAKVSAIKNAPAPRCVKDVRSFLGMVTYCAKFIPNFSDLTEPLRKLTIKNAHFRWTNEEECAFNKVKHALTSDKVMAYFDQNKQTELTTDASPWGLSAILSQCTSGTNNRKVVAYISRTLSEVERRYSQTEREALAIVWAMERLHLYLSGAKFTLYTDCKPVEMILGNPKSKPPARIERWNLRIQDFDFNVVYTSGANNASDFLSRHPSSSDAARVQEDVAEEYVNFLTAHAVPKAMTLKEIKEETKKDEILQELVKIIREQLWDSKKAFNGDNGNELRKYINFQDELTINDDTDIVLRGSRIVIPSSLRNRAISIAHEGHQGLVKTKQLIREKIWFPGIDKAVKDMIGSCIACQANSNPNPPTPLKMNELPPEPWHTVHLDFCGPFLTGEYVLVAIDAYSRFPEVEIIRSTSATVTISKLERIFSTHGLPQVIKSDNGPPFNSREFKTYMQENGIKHQRITPLWPQANSEAENFMKPLEKAIRAAITEHKNWTRELYSFLLNYRATPHSTTKFSPAELLFNRPIKMKLPNPVRHTHETVKDQQVRENDVKAKNKMKSNADRAKHAKETKLCLGDTVLVRQKNKNKFSTRYDPSPYQVTSINGSMVTASRPGHSITRNISFYKKIQLQQRKGQWQDWNNMEEDISDVSDNINDERNEQGENEIQERRYPDRNVQGENEVQERRYPERDRRPINRYVQNIYE